MHRVLLLLPTSTYKTGAYLTAAARLGMEIVVASEQPSTLAAKNPEGLLTLDFTNPEKSARVVASFAAQYPIDAVIPVDEDTAVVAAHIDCALGLDQNAVPGAEAARNKYLMRQALRQAALPVPRAHIADGFIEHDGGLDARCNRPAVKCHGIRVRSCTQQW